ncbi:probable iron/ascorbate oxidoreductase DDB_G0283291 [Actinia tenebrosa]|uniref:Probable iron/ascorbate oxidoreductase DDB_G0283291 n=1 Tax=Actinia tenebrosa TaxID=6105 RepID=A0A6P8I7N6_ACTTE|nr:probable iron/ascorbate oxidoreductase DDB_G0283291 [Actinia tenebrosa]
MNAAQIPVIDISPLITSKGEISYQNVVRKIASACLEYGFFYVSDHNIKATLQKGLFDCLWQFFCLPQNQKDEIRKKEGSFRGYFGMEEEVSTETKISDWKEGIYYFQDINLPKNRPESVFNGTNPLPKKEYLPNFENVIMEYFQKTITLGSTIMSAVAVGLGVGKDFFEEKFTSEPFVQLAMFHYPPYKNAIHNDDFKWGVQEHTDYGVLTVLMQDDVGGLQVQLKNCEWIEVPPIPNTFVINIGDALESWTSGAYRAAPHRVLASSSRDRMSVAMFYAPSFDCVVTPIPLENTVIPVEAANENLKMKSTFVYGEYVLSKYRAILDHN